MWKANVSTMYLNRIFIVTYSIEIQSSLLALHSSPIRIHQSKREPTQFVLSILMPLLQQLFWCMPYNEFISIWKLKFSSRYRYLTASIMKTLKQWKWVTEEKRIKRSADSSTTVSNVFCVLGALFQTHPKSEVFRIYICIIYVTFPLHPHTILHTIFILFHSIRRSTVKSNNCFLFVPTKTCSYLAYTHTHMYTHPIELSFKFQGLMLHWISIIKVR